MFVMNGRFVKRFKVERTAPYISVLLDTFSRRSTVKAKACYAPMEQRMRDSLIKRRCQGCMGQEIERLRLQSGLLRVCERIGAAQFSKSK